MFLALTIRSAAKPSHHARKASKHRLQGQSRPKNVAPSTPTNGTILLSQETEGAE